MLVVVKQAVALFDGLHVLAVVEGTFRFARSLHRLEQALQLVEHVDFRLFVHAEVGIACIGAFVLLRVLLFDWFVTEDVLAEWLRVEKHLSG